MQYIINRNYGCFRVPKEVQSMIGCDLYDDGDDIRTNRIFIDWVLTHEFSVESSLCVVDIPDKATDWKLQEYDGFESIIAVVDGKLLILP